MTSFFLGCPYDVHVYGIHEGNSFQVCVYSWSCPRFPGAEMSKSLGNGIDPLEVIEKYGADALRFTLVTGNTPGNDMRFYYERVEGNRNFANKLWNASKFTLMNLDDYDPCFIPEESQYTLADKWIWKVLRRRKSMSARTLINMS